MASEGFLNTIINENCLTGLLQLPDNSIDCCVTSPPYFGLRDYGNNEQIGLEETPELFVQQLVKVFEEVKKVLKPEGTLWLNLGDSYWGGKGQSGQKDASIQEERNLSGKSLNVGAQQMGGKGITMPKDGKHPVIKPKDLIGIPWMVAFALRANGWYLRQDIIWNKPNPMPESMNDRCTKSHEYIFLMSKEAKYYYDADAIKTITKDVSLARMDRGVSDNHKNINGAPGQTPHSMNQPRDNKKMPTVGGKKHKNLLDKGQQVHSMHRTRNENGTEFYAEKANKRSVWTVTTKPFSEAHFATFPEELIVDCIKAGCPENGIVLDPFMGSGTTAVVSKKLGRNYVGFELNKEYLKIAENRLYNEIGMFL
ncbi:MAG: site-specific DNA-methyltransferase [Bacteroidales bacterium]|nr:site-specific DNA-methyltransferase [Bacteroidales bacterium]